MMRKNFVRWYDSLEQKGITGFFLLKVLTDLAIEETPLSEIRILSGHRRERLRYAEAMGWLIYTDANIGVPAAQWSWSGRPGSAVPRAAARVAAMIRIYESWLANESLDMRAGPDKAMARVVQVFGSARPHCAYLFTNKRGNRMKALIHYGLCVWLCARRLNRGKVRWGESWRGKRLQLT